MPNLQTRRGDPPGFELPSDLDGVYVLGVTSEDSGDVADVTQREFARGQKLFGRYTLVKILGRGGMGIVWLARDEELEREVALKFLPDLMIHDRAVIDQLKRETKRCLELTHPHIVRIYDFIHDDRSGCISMEYVDGETLASLRCNKLQQVFEPFELSGWTNQICEALDYAHNRARIIHRDLKPANLMVNQRGEVKVSDFGIARSLSDSVSMLTREQGRSGTLVYMSPQQLAGERGSHLDDIYSLGASLYELLTSKPPFYSGNIDRQIHERIAPSMTERRKEFNIEPALLPSAWEETVAACLAKDPAKRPQAASEIARRLHASLAPTSDKIPEILVKRSKKQILIPIALVALCLIAVGAFYFIGKKEQPVVAPSAANAPGAQPALTVAAPVAEKSIAVLPFENLSKEEENAFFAAGVQDEILTNLAKIADLKVISRTSVMKYKTGPERNLREIAKTLDVSHVVEGSVQRAGGRIRVTAQLIDARSDEHLWAEHYDRDFADVFAIQSEIAQQIADQLRTKLSPAEKAAITDRPTADLVAYALYTKAKTMDSDSNNWDWEKLSNQQAELLEKATQRDPNFALAYCALAKTQIDLSSLTQDPSLSRAHLDLAKKAAEAAVRVRPDLGEAHLELARYYYYAGIDTGDFDPVRDELVIARRTLPNDSNAIAIAGRIDKRQNRWDEALANFRKASELDPRNDELAYFLRLTLLEMRRYHELEQLFAKDAGSGTEKILWIRFRLAELKLAEGDPVAAQALLEQVPLDFNPVHEIWSVRFTAALYLRDYDAASRVIAATPAKFADNAFEGQPPESWADGQIARARGDKQKAVPAFAAARKKLEATWETKFKNQPYFALELLASFDAGLGRKEDAIREARQAVDLLPIAKDSYWGPHCVTTLALVYTWTGERDRAIEQLEIVAKVPNGPSYGDLKFNPCWDALRGDARFEKIVASLTPKL
jgi:serine/threonine protein kinase/TolB-like protein